MNRIGTYPFCFLLIVLYIEMRLMPVSAAEMDPKGWEWYAEVQTDDVLGQFVELPISPEVFDRCKQFPVDVRIVDSVNQLVPHLMDCLDEPEVKIIETPVQRLNETYIPNQYARVVLDYGKMTPKNQLRVELSGGNYRRRVLLEGGNDGEKWEIIAEDLYLFDMKLHGHHYEEDLLVFPLNTFRFLRLTVYNMKDDPEKISIHSIRTIHTEIIDENQLIPVPIVQQDIHGTTETIVDLDLGYRNLPLYEVSLAVSDPNFYREYQVYGRNSLTETHSQQMEESWREETLETPWKLIQRGEIYRIWQDDMKVERLRMALRKQSGYRYIQIRIQNEDNPPLDIEEISITCSPCRLIFKAEPEKQYRLFGGNEDTQPPSYDLARSMPDLDEAVLETVELGEIHELITEEEPVPWTERHPYLVTGFLAIAVLLMLAFLLPSLKASTDTADTTHTE